eukprot:gene7404-8656_t
MNLKQKKVIIPLVATILAICLIVALATSLSLKKKHDNDKARPTFQMTIDRFSSVQTHIIPEEGLAWSLPVVNRNFSYHLVGNRDTMVMFEITLEKDFAFESPVVEAWLADKKLGEKALRLPSETPRNDNGTAFPNATYTAMLPAAWIQVNVSVCVSADNYKQSVFKQLDVGMPASRIIHNLPFFLFGANEANMPNTTDMLNQTDIDELHQKWPLSSLTIVEHPAKRIIWPYIVMGPLEGGPAVKIFSKVPEVDKFDIMGVILDVLWAIRKSNGLTTTDMQYYAPMMMLNQTTNKYIDPMGGLGGNGQGSGNHYYTGVYIHEMGHASGLGHAKEGYIGGSYPYINGSVKGSTWGYDANHDQFLGTFIPTTASSFAKCRTNVDRVKDEFGNCWKMDIMSSGSGDQATGYTYSMYPDFDMGVVQKSHEGLTTVDDKSGDHEYDGGRVIYMPDAFPSGYARWDTLDRKFVEVVPTNGSGIDGMDSQLPMQRDVAVHTIILTYSTTTSSVNQIYPPLSYIGNLRRWIDPTVPEQLAVITPGSKNMTWFCYWNGCDFTIRVTYTDNSKIHMAIQDGYRASSKPSGGVDPKTQDPNDKASFYLLSVNVPGDKKLKTIELLDTPMVWTGLPTNPKVLCLRRHTIK